MEPRRLKDRLCEVGLTKMYFLFYFISWGRRVYVKFAQFLQQTCIYLSKFNTLPDKNVSLYVTCNYRFFTFIVSVHLCKTGLAKIQLE